MLKPDLASIEALMKRVISKTKGDGALTTKEGEPVNIKQFFGFAPQDVEGIHTHKTDEGDGVWFRLKDGRVFNRFGKPAAADTALYDTVKE
jgi:hypothetical protein